MYIIHTHYYTYMYIHMYTFTSACTHIYPLVLHVHVHYTHPLSQYIYFYTCMHTYTCPLVLHVHVHIYSANSFMYSTCMYIIISAHWIYLYIICTKAEKIVLTFKSFVPLANINFGEYCQCVPEKLRPVFCLSFHFIDAKSE